MWTRRSGHGECDKVGAWPNETAVLGETLVFTATGCDYSDRGLAVLLHWEIELTCDGSDVTVDRLSSNVSANIVLGVLRALTYYGGGAGTGRLTYVG